MKLSRKPTVKRVLTVTLLIGYRYFLHIVLVNRTGLWRDTRGVAGLESRLRDAR